MKPITRHSFKTLFAAIFFTALGMFALNVQASSVYFLNIDGIAGESTDKAHAHWIEIDSFSWGLSNSQGGGSGGGTGKSTFSPFSWTQKLDASVPNIMLGVASGKHFKTATLDVVKPNGSGVSSSYFKMEFDNVLLTSMNMSGTGSVPMVNAALDGYNKVTLTYRPQLPDGRFGAAVVGGWDIGNGGPIYFGSPLALEGLFLAGPSSPVPVPAAAWLLGSGLLGLVGVVRRKAA